jgi:hypothetical protein
VFAPNLGKAERAIRLLLGLLLGGWVLLQPEPGPGEALCAVASVFLILNALYGRCYLWRFLGINSCKHPVR